MKVTIKKQNIEMENCKKLTLSFNASKSYNVPIDAPITGKQGIREDIPITLAQSSISLVMTGLDRTISDAGTAFTDRFVGKYTVVSSSSIKEGGESPNPNPLSTFNIIQVEE